MKTQLRGVIMSMNIGYLEIEIVEHHPLIKILCCAVSLFVAPFALVLVALCFSGMVIKDM